MEASGHLHAPAAIQQGERPHSILWMGDWVSPIANLKVLEEKKLLLLPGIEPSFVQPSHYTPYAIPDFTECRTFED